MTIKSSKILVVLLLLVAVALGIRAGLAPHSVKTNIQWVHYSEADLPEQDVFIELKGAQLDASDPDFLGVNAVRVPSIIRVEGKSALTPSNLAKMVYAASTIVPHDPFKLNPNPLGPYNRGEPLGFTLRQWLAARGHGTYAVSGEDAELDLAFQQLVPKGHYALWCGRVSVTPHYEEVEKVCGAKDGSQNQFRADAQGNGGFHLNLKALPESTQAFTTVLVLSYERDIDSSAGEWGGYGLNSHVQLLYAFPVSSNVTLVCGGQSAC